MKINKIVSIALLSAIVISTGFSTTTTAYASTANSAVATVNSATETLTVSASNGVIYGYAKDEFGHPLANRDIYVVKNTNNKINTLLPSQVFSDAVTNANGYFSTPGYCPPGNSYYVYLSTGKYATADEAAEFLDYGGQWPSNWMTHSGDLLDIRTRIYF